MSASLPVALILLLDACECDHRPPPEASPDASTPTGQSAEIPPKLLYLPDGATRVSDLPAIEPGSLAAPKSERCPAEMVDVAGRFCIDRFEISLDDERMGLPLSPYYHPTAAQTRATYEKWRRQPDLAGTLLGDRLDVPVPPPFQLDGPIVPVARVRNDAHPSAYLSQPLAAQACQNAGKRLCSDEEWMRACRGEKDTAFPYGDAYEPGRCNVFRDAHPAALLHGNASANHTDPRLNLVSHGGAPLLRRTARSSCASPWGSDAVYDMVGNLDEWTADPEGTFRGGFYSRATRAGCEAAVSSHAPEYFDYSLGARCCR